MDSEVRREPFHADWTDRHSRYRPCRMPLPELPAQNALEDSLDGSVDPSVIPPTDPSSFSRLEHSGRKQVLRLHQSSRGSCALHSLTCPSDDTPAYASAVRAFLLALTCLALPHAPPVAYWSTDSAATPLTGSPPFTQCTTTISTRTTAWRWNWRRAEQPGSCRS